MRACIVYSSRTGNTRLVGEHLAESLRLPLFSVEEAPLSGYDTYILGFWTWRGGPDAAMAAFMNRLPGRNVFFSAPWWRNRIPSTPPAVRSVPASFWKRGVAACSGIFLSGQAG